MRPSLACAQGPVCVGARLRLAERRLQRVQEVQAKRELLRGELAETQGRLMLEPGRWLEQCEFPQPRPAPQFSESGAGVGAAKVHGGSPRPSRAVPALPPSCEATQ